MYKIKISLDQITYGPNTPEVDEVVAFVYAGELLKKGYRKVSNAYCTVKRIDRDDWLDVLAKQLHCSRADFYKLDGSGVDDRWRDHYVRGHSNDSQIVHPSVLKLIPNY